MFDQFATSIKDIHIDVQSIIDAGGSIDGQILAEHRIKLATKVKEIAEDFKQRLRRNRDYDIKELKSEIRSKDILFRKIKEVDTKVKLEEKKIEELRERKVTLLLDETNISSGTNKPLSKARGVSKGHR